MMMLKRAALEIGFRTGLFRLTQLAVRHRPMILMFHRFAGDGHGHPLGLPIDRFARFLDYLTSRYRVVRLDELTHELARGAVKPSTVAITVDDGYHEVLSLVGPLLRRYRVPATFFVVNDLVAGRLWLWTDKFRFVFDHAGDGVIEFRHRGAIHRIEIHDPVDRFRQAEAWKGYAKRLPIAERDELLGALGAAAGVTLPPTPPPEYRAMSWAELRELVRDGFDVGGHTRTHPILSRIPARELDGEIAEAKEEMERQLGVAVRHFAYPNGTPEDYTAETVRAVAKAGYRAAVTAIAGANTPATSPLELHRVDGGAPDLAHFAQSVCGFEQARLGTRAAVGRAGRRPELSGVAR